MCNRIQVPRQETRQSISCLEHGDKVLGLDLAHGGHLTHGMHLNVSGILYDFVSYGVDPETHRLDLDSIA